jgi:hypothetical protein
MQLRRALTGTEVCSSFVLMMQGFPISAKLPEDLGFGERFWYWRGISGQSYIHSIYSREACPPLPGAVFVAVRQVRDRAVRWLWAAFLRHSKAVPSILRLMPPSSAPATRSMFTCWRATMKPPPACWRSAAGAERKQTDSRGCTLRFRRTSSAGPDRGLIAKPRARRSSVSSRIFISRRWLTVS